MASQGYYVQHGPFISCYAGLNQHMLMVQGCLRATVPALERHMGLHARPACSSTARPAPWTTGSPMPGLKLLPLPSQTRHVTTLAAMLVVLDAVVHAQYTSEVALAKGLHVVTARQMNRLLGLFLSQSLVPAIMHTMTDTLQNQRVLLVKRGLSCSACWAEAACRHVLR